MINDLTEEYLRICCFKGMTDSQIGNIFGMTGEGIAYRRKKIGLAVSDKYNFIRERIKFLEGTRIEIIKKNYYEMTGNEFSKKYGLSRTVWGPFLKKLGIISKTVHRIESYKPFTFPQRFLLVGSLLGDGSVSQGNFFYESHSLKQKLYLENKINILYPYSLSPYSCDNGTGVRFKTIQHPNFLEFFNEFYREGIKGKLIPLEFIRKNWDDIILSYWFFDDGYYDKKKNELTIANKCPYYKMLDDFVVFLNERFKWKFSIWRKSDMYFVTFSKKFYVDFSELLLKSATPDVLYKIPLPKNRYK